MTTPEHDPRWNRLVHRHGSEAAALEALLARSDAFDRMVMALRIQGVHADRMLED